MKVAVIMSNDYPVDVVLAERAEERCEELREKAHEEWKQNGGSSSIGERFKGSGDRWIRAYEFEVKA